MITVEIIESYDPVTRLTFYTASCITPVEPETTPQQARLFSPPLSTQNGAIENLRKRYLEYMGKDKARVRWQAVEVNW